MPDLTFTSRNPNTGEEETHAIDPEDLVAITMPLQPAVVNPKYVKRLTAKDWRHRETNWYDAEHEFLERFRQSHPHHGQLVDEMRLRLYAVFAHVAGIRSPRSKLDKSSRKHFTKRYDAFVRKWGRFPMHPSAFMSTKLAQDPDDYLRSVTTWSYYELRMTVTTLLKGG